MWQALQDPYKYAGLCCRQHLENFHIRHSRGTRNNTVINACQATIERRHVRISRTFIEDLPHFLDVFLTICQLQQKTFEEARASRRRYP